MRIVKTLLEFIQAPKRVRELEHENRQVRSALNYQKERNAELRLALRGKKKGWENIEDYCKAAKKHSFTNQKAKKIAQRMSRKHGKPINAYKCRYGNHWHVGNSR
jgi:hypothetical protein